MTLLQEHEARMCKVEPKPLTPQEERWEMFGVLAVGAFIGYLITEIIFAGGCVS